MTILGPFDARDVFFLIAGIALLGLTLEPWLKRTPLFNLPAFYIAGGAGLGLWGLPVINPLSGGISTSIVEHMAELIVIVSLAGAGLAIDAPNRWRDWQPVIRLLAFTMPLTIAAIAALGLAAGLPIAAALLLAAAMAPTDPVLARSVQVGAPGEHETPMQIALTGEAGLNDGLAFPFVYLAITVAGLSAGARWEDWGWEWLRWDFAYRVVAALILGYITGRLVSRMIFAIGDGRYGQGWNATLTVLGATFLSYGLTEAVEGYGFLAVFMAARAGRDASRGTEADEYSKHVHHGADQMESILLALSLIWFGMFAVTVGLAGLSWVEVGVALAILLVVRPLAGRIALWGYDCPSQEANKIAFFGIRGMGSVFYIAYAQNHADFAGIDVVWRIATITIVLSVLLHGYAANAFIEADEADAEEEPHPRATDA